MEKPPLAQDSACWTSKEAPHVQINGNLGNDMPYRRYKPSPRKHGRNGKKPWELGCHMASNGKHEFNY